MLLKEDFKEGAGVGAEGHGGERRKTRCRN